MIFVFLSPGNQPKILAHPEFKDLSTPESIFERIVSGEAEADEKRFVFKSCWQSVYTLSLTYAHNERDRRRNGKNKKMRSEKLRRQH